MEQKALVTICLFSDAIEILKSIADIMTNIIYDNSVMVDNMDGDNLYEMLSHTYLVTDESPNLLNLTAFGDVALLSTLKSHFSLVHTEFTKVPNTTTEYTRVGKDDKVYYVVDSTTNAISPPAYNIMVLTITTFEMIIDNLTYNLVAFCKKIDLSEDAIKQMLSDIEEVIQQIKNS